MPAECPPSFVELTMQSVDYEPENRPTSDDATEWLKACFHEMEIALRHPLRQLALQQLVKAIYSLIFRHY